MSKSIIHVPAGYEALGDVLAAAIHEAAFGKGTERHGNGEPFDRQPMMEITKMTCIGFPLGQAQKKAQEACLFSHAGNVEKARAEILGAINYLAGAYILTAAPCSFSPKGEQE